jgi:hypothetical protein
MQYKIINGVIFSEFEINDKEKIKKVLKDVQVLNDRTKTFATLKGILEKTKLDHDESFINRLMRLPISRTTDYLGVRYTRHSKLLYSGEDLHYLRKLYLEGKLV